jgi:steroid delta-isomerase-like uncharacterized protein
MLSKPIVLAVALGAALFAPSVARSEDNKSIVRRWFDVLETGKLDMADDVIAPDFIVHDSSMPEAKGPEGMKQRARLLRTAFPDIKYTFGEWVTEGDKVATHWTLRGTHKGAFRDIAPTGKQVAVTGTVIFRLANGKIQESWVNWDALGLMEQLGAFPAARPNKK